MSHHDFLADVLVFLAAALAVVPVFRRFSIGPVLGYLVAGILVGPHALGLIGENESIDALAEIGIAFLLFSVGLEVSFGRLRALRAYVFGLGGLQMAVCGAALAAVAWASGLAASGSLVVGAALAFSSTAVVLALLRESGEMAAQTGRIALSILLLQDLAVVPLLVLVPLIAEPGGGLWVALGQAALRAAVALAGIFLIGRILLRPLFRVVARGRVPELLVAFTLFVALGLGWVTQLAGLSLALGAFLAGLLLAETEFHHQVEADIQPFRGLLLGLFFMAVGLRIDLGLAASHFLAVAAIVVGVLAIKGVLIAGLCRSFGLSAEVSVRQGLLLAQGGEFAFVVLGLAATHGVVPGSEGAILTLAIAITMALTPPLAALGLRWAAAMKRTDHGGHERLESESRDLREHVLIAGFGRVGQTVAELMSAAGVPFLALDLDPGRVAAARTKGAPVYFGDAANRDVLRAARAHAARAIIVTVDDPPAALRAVRLLRDRLPETPIFARARDSRNHTELMRAGASAVVPETLEASLQLGGFALRGLGIAESEIAVTLARVRGADAAAASEVAMVGTDNGKP